MRFWCRWMDHGSLDGYNNNSPVEDTQWGDQFQWSNMDWKEWCNTYQQDPVMSYHTNNSACFHRMFTNMLMCNPTHCLTASNSTWYTLSAVTTGAIGYSYIWVITNSQIESNMGLRWNSTAFSVDICLLFTALSTFCSQCSIHISTMTAVAFIQSYLCNTV